MATYSRHCASYAPPTKTLPIIMPSKAAPYHQATSRVAISPPEYESSSSSRHSHSSSGNSYSVSSRASDRGSSQYGKSGSSTHSYRDSDDKYDAPGHRQSVRGRVDVDLVEMLTEGMDKVSDFTKMDRSVARQAQDSGRLNAANAELAELQALATRRLKTVRVNFAQGVEDAKEIRRDLDYCRGKTDSMRTKAERKHPSEYASAKTKPRSRHAA